MTSSGFRLRNLLSMLYDMPAGRIDFGDPELADRRLDVAVRLPAEESEHSMRQRVAHALEQQIGIAIRPITRTQDVFSVTVADQARLPSQGASFRGGGFTSTMTEITLRPSEKKLGTPQEIENLMRQTIQVERDRNGMSLDSIDIEGSVQDLCLILETDLHRPVLDRTGFTGTFKLSVRRNGLDRDHFFELLKTEHGLSISQAQAQVEHLIVMRAPVGTD